MSTLNILKSLNLPSNKYTYSVKKNFLRNSYLTDLNLTLELKNESKFVSSCRDLAELAVEIFSSPLINKKGRSIDERIFYLEGTLSEDEKSFRPETDYSIEISSKFDGAKKPKQYFQIIITTVSGIEYFDVSLESHKILDYLNQSNKIICCELHLELLKEHFFYQLGFAPQIEEAINVSLNNKNLNLEINIAGNFVIEPNLSPINETFWWNKITQLIDLAINR